MQHGEKIKPEVREFVRKFSNSKPRPALKEIVLEVSKRFGVKISPRSVGRYCEKTSPQQQTNVPLSDPPQIECSNPPDRIDVLTLKSWGIPAKEAPVLLQRWEIHHRNGEHSVCESFNLLKEYLTAKNISFKQAYALTSLRRKALKLGLNNVKKTVDIAVKYRPWENLQNQKVTFEEISIKDNEAPS
ncbi:helix-turn-helix domain-containing protein [Dehalogenimonas alkenigignens]|uniref:helix-turn-helix domain-containing protein n=1 Tax=Dehalogenimonas alkenigignens TaxID=1217799 RepID=UPI000D5867AD|nr:helix-turn-helix domain-containing protein [Dehalogenimonas alkenigignens]PVV82562.1 hypothetical protein DD509_08475 [Dehalogenimonas alkenigignens]